MAMNTTSPRGLAASTNRSFRPVYEDFRPLIEPKEDPQAKTVHIHLSGFSKEQIRIVAESGRRVLRVRGERLIAVNKWIRFLEEVTVPENCDMAETTAKFEGGFLRISMPRKNATAPRMETPIHEIPPQAEPKFTPCVDDKPKSAHVLQTLDQEEAERRKDAIEHEKNRMGKELLGEESAECDTMERLKEDDKYRKAMKGMYLRRLETERKMLMNVGVAAVLIVALGGWISYSISSSARSTM